jgi:hypothetical protein
MTTVTQQTDVKIFLFPRLFSAIIAEKQEQMKRFVNDLNEQTDVWEILKNWHYSTLLPAGKKKMVWELSDLKKYLISREQKKIDKEIVKQRERLTTVSKADNFEGATISVEWKKSRMWGNNPKAEARIEKPDSRCFYESGSISGCGYDKESTAIAEAINQSNEFLKLLYLAKENDPTAKNGELLGYGSGYGILPRLEGGVGVSCYPRIFEKIGFDFHNSASGKTFDVYTITKK